MHTDVQRALLINQVCVEPTSNHNISDVQCQIVHYFARRITDDYVFVGVSLCRPGLLLQLPSHSSTCCKASSPDNSETALVVALSLFKMVGQLLREL